MNCLRLLIASALIACQSPASAQNPPSRDGFLCFKEACVGDTIDKVLHLPWMPALGSGIHYRTPITSLHMNDAMRKDLAKAMRADADTLREVAPYFIYEAADKRGLAALAKVTAVCRRHAGLGGRVEAKYRSESGHVTTVHFQSVPSQDGRSQAFVITEMVRLFEGPINQQQENALYKEIESRYAGFSKMASEDESKWSFELHTSGGRQLRLSYPSRPLMKRLAKLEDHPLCDKPKPTKLD